MTERTGYNVISADSHVVEPPDVFAGLPASVKDRAPKLAAHEGGAAWFVDGVEPAPLSPTFASGSAWRKPATPSITFDQVLPGLYEPAERIKAQDSDSVDAELLYPTPALWDAIKVSKDDELTLACIRTYNDWLSEFCKHNPDRFFGVAKIPSTSVADAVAELKRATGELGLTGALLDAFPSGSAVGGHPDDDPFWETVNELQVPVSIHYGLGLETATEPASGIGPGLKPPMADSVLPMVAGGVFDRFPDVKVVLAHADAGWALHWMEFFDINYVRQKHLAQYLLQRDDAVPSDYFRRFCWFTFHQDRSTVKKRQVLGQVHMIWASHFPYEDSNWPDNRQQAMNVTDEIPAADRQALLADNVGRLYGLPGYKQGFSTDEIDAFEQLVHF